MIIERKEFQHLQDAAFVHDFSQEYAKCEGKLSIAIRMCRKENGCLSVSVSGEKASQQGFSFQYTESQFCKFTYEGFIQMFYKNCGEEAPTEEQMTIWS